MKSIRVAQKTRIVFEMGYGKFADSVSQMYEPVLDHLESLYGIRQTNAVEIVICASPLTFLFHALTGLRRILAQFTMPLWKRPVMQFYDRAGGVTLHVGDQAFVWIRPPDDYAYVERTIGNVLFGQITDPDLRLKFVFAHEMTHALIGNRKLPAWINEGLAMYAVDMYLDRHTVLQETLGKCPCTKQRCRLVTYREMLRAKTQDIVCTYAFGYWSVRYMAENDPAAIQGAVTQGLNGEGFVKHIFAQMSIQSVWDLSAILSHYFNQDKSE